MFRVKRPGEQPSRKLRVPRPIWIILILASILGLILTRYCHTQLNKYLEVKNIEIESLSPALAQICFEIENKADFFIKRKVVVRLYSGNLEIGSKIVTVKLKENYKTGFVVTINFIKLLKEDETIDEVSVRFYD